MSEESDTAVADTPVADGPVADSEAPAAAEAGSQPETAYGVAVTDSRGQMVLHPDRETYVETITALRDDGFVSVMDLCGVDNLNRVTRDLPVGVGAERFEVVVSLIAHEPPRRIRVRVQIPENDPTVASLFDVFPGTENLERETWDMFGVTFDGHPDPSRILMPPDWQGHPLRKDFAVGSVPVQFKGAAAPR